MEKKEAGRLVCTFEDLLRLGFNKDSIRNTRFWRRTDDGKVIVPAKKVSEVKIRRCVAQGQSLAVQLRDAHENGWKDFVHIYKDEAERKAKAMRHALAEKCRSLTGAGHAKNEVFQACQTLGFCKDGRTFERLLTSPSFTHGGKGNANAAKLTDGHRQIIEHHYAQPNQFCTQAITEKVNADLRVGGLEPVSYSSVRKYLQNPEIRTKYARLRQGPSFVYNKVEPYISFKPAELVGRLAEMDGVSYPLLYLENGQMKRAVLFAIVDAASRKLTGWAVGKSENRWLVNQTLRNHAEKTGWLPKRIMTDNFGAKKTAEHGRLEDELLLHDCQIGYHRPGNPRGKPHIERVFKVLQDRFSREHPAFLGMGILSKSQSSHRNAEAYQKHVKANGLPGFEAVRKMIGEAIEAYNAHCFGGRPSPDELFETLPKADVRHLDAEEIAKLFWNRTQVKANRGHLTLTINKAEYRYCVHLRHNDKAVPVYYDPSDMSQVMATLDGADVTLLQDVGTDRFDLPAIRRKKNLINEDNAYLAVSAPEITRKADLSEAQNHFDTKELGVYTASFNPEQSMEEFYKTLNVPLWDDEQ